MKICGIICEYNPFHKGHEYHVLKTKKDTNCDVVIGIMSGNFAQRGIPTIIDKWERTKMALSSGVDLIIELPAIFALSSAEIFAKGSIELLDKLNVVDYVSFGSECGDLNIINVIAEALAYEPFEFKIYLKKYLDTGLPFPRARALALSDYFKEKNISYDDFDKILNSPNNLLAIEYCKTLLKINSSITPFTIKRQGNGYNDIELKNAFASASAIREHLKSSNTNIKFLETYMTEKSIDLMQNLIAKEYKFIFPEAIFPFLKYKILTSENNIYKIPEASEGLDRKILKEISNSVSLKELIEKVKSKRYTYTRISRILCQYFVGFEEYDIYSLRKSTPEYARILGFNSKGAAILKEIKKSSSIKLITKVPKECSDMLSLDLKATRSYSVLNPFIDPYADFKTSPIITK
ncbi:MULTISPECIES: nucleotidyltransferase [Clostridium]|uniref:tRNA(Met) cytidine acetate ligase n=1 Tax=Clostridium cadaveris TaxID=1529 RepID=A0A1I2JBT3_9CLOT|nr:nucleotidyltransferase [Clostridium cadaveris]MDU4953146.1 nucleotidyltransferase [Clostridium sp.]MDM8311092.1 nucleotidyltransferase [Clostridium cadaveris]NME64169.1 nucleotidyltransferase [Clostridium cadaveris]PWL53498.1 MAG: nucleotidyltransferase [Clostridium cadaveris]UFH66396.1 nucleotidyltransferase [Clostridium cadaveris]